MSPTWLDNLERSLEERLEQFLSSNPSQDQLLREQHLQDRQRDLHNRRGQQQLQARELRRQLLTLAEQVQAWTKRGEKARRADALELAFQRAGILEHAAVNNLHGVKGADGVARQPDFAIGSLADAAEQLVIGNGWPRGLAADDRRPEFRAGVPNR